MDIHPAARPLVGTVIGLLAAVLVGCGSQPSAAPRPSATFTYRPGLRAEVFLPASGRRPAPLVVLVPGGGWRSADPTGLAPLASALAAKGIAAVTATYRVGSAGSRFPVPVEDITCAVSGAAARVAAEGVRPTRVVLLGHSAGAQLAAVAALAGDRFGGSCAWPAARIDGLVGLAGPYDIERFADVAEPLLGAPPSAQPQQWQRADALTYARLRPQLPVLLATGGADRLVSPMFTEVFGAALREGGHPVRVLTIAGADHASIYRPETIAAAVIAWVGALR